MLLNDHGGAPSRAGRCFSSRHPQNNAPSQKSNSGTWGSVSGLNMEFAVSWPELGLAPGTPFTFHVSSTNSSLNAANIAAKIDDNLSGGGSTSTQFAALTFIPDLALSGQHLDAVVGAHNPKAIPGAVAAYTITVNNQGGRPADVDSTVITDTVPADSSLMVSDIGGAGSGPLNFSDGSPASGLTYTFSSLASTTDDLEFSSDGGASFGYTPTPDGNGVDASVTDIRINPKGVFLPSSGAGNPGFNIGFRVRVD